MAERYYWPGNPLYTPAAVTGTATGTIVELHGDEAHHLTRVMRQKTGDIVTLFDGDGHEFSAEITETQKNRVLFRILGVRDVDTEPPCRVTVAVSLPKSDRQKWLVEKLTELGCHRLIPLQTERSVAQCNDQVLERLRRQVLEATKQCNRTRLMQISPEQTIAGFGGVQSSEIRVQSNHNHSELTSWIAHPRSDDDFGQCDLSDLMQAALPKRVLVLVGPEGGFTRQEVEQAVTLGMQPLDLGPRILRVETAAMVLTAILTALP